MSEDARRASTESADSASSTPTLRNAATAAPGEKVASLESADESVRAKTRRRWREDFYDHFLDGAAGVMYTSFLGLILDDLIALGTGKYKKC